jgi:FdhD protein
MKRRELTRTQVELVRRGRTRRTNDAVAVEEPLEIRAVTLQDGEQLTESLAVTMRTPGKDFELAAGFLYTEGILRRPDDIDRIQYSAECPSDDLLNIVDVRLRPGVAIDTSRSARTFYMTSSCGVCGKASLDAIRTRGVPRMPRDRPRIQGSEVTRLPERLRATQAVFEETGGLHAAGLFDDSGRLHGTREDIGRHNAVDKLIGREVLEDRLPLTNRGLVVSGRASFEILQKAAVAGIPLVVAVGAPSSLAVSTAKEFGMTLVGFARGDSFNVYSGSQRIGAPRARQSAQKSARRRRPLK